MILNLEGIVTYEPTQEAEEIAEEPAQLYPPHKPPPPDPVGEMVEAGIYAKYLLVEIVKRAAYDWVLYRNSDKVEQQEIAKEAYTWLFEEDETHAHWAWRIREGKELTAFITICDELDMDVSRIRGYIQRLKPQNILAAGKTPLVSSHNQQDFNLRLHVDVADISYDTDEFDVLDGFDY
jgi:hypothetical protein